MIILKPNLLPLDPFGHYLNLLLPKRPVDEDLLQLLVGKVDDKLLEPVLLEGLESVNVQNPEDLMLPLCFNLHSSRYIIYIFIFVLYIYTH